MSTPVTVYAGPAGGWFKFAVAPYYRGGDVDGTGGVDIEVSDSSPLDGDTITISTDGTYDFTVKTNAKPLLWWQADDGIAAPSSLGRTTAWDGTFNGALSAVEVATNSTNAARLDLSGGDSGLSVVLFTSDYLYEFRKIYEDFDIDTDIGYRLRYTTLSGTLNVGDVVTDDGTSATGVIQSVTDSGGGAGVILFEPTGGTINPATNANFTQYGASTTDSAATFTNNEGDSDGLLRSFNNKILRMWSNGGLNKPSPHINIQGTNADNNYDLTVEGSGTEGTVWSAGWNNQLPSTKEVWVSQELDYVASSAVDVQDGKFVFRQDGVLGYDGNITHRSTALPYKCDRIYQHQVSNDCQPLSYVYYDCLYVDDTRHRVVITDAATWDDNAGDVREIQIPATWAQTSISIKVRQGSFTNFTGKYLYVIDSAGVPVTTAGVALS